MRRLAGTVVVLFMVALMSVTAGPDSHAGVAPTSLPDPSGDERRAAAAAAALVAGRPASLHVGPDDGFVALPVISSMGWRYVPYERTYRGLPVVGGDFVVVVDPTGRVRSTSVAQKYAVKGVDTAPKVTLAAARSTAAGRLRSVSKMEAGRLVVYALGATPRLAWESTVNGRGAEGESRLTVRVDAITGAVLDSRESVMHDRGFGAYNGIRSILTTLTDGDLGTRLLRDPSTRALSCGGPTGETFESFDQIWGNGQFDDLETQCVDAMFAAQTQGRMLSAWLGRSRSDGTGGAWPIRVGAGDGGRFTGTTVELGYMNDLGHKPATSLDIVGHEMGHGIDRSTPGGRSGNGTAEFIADVFGTATEWYANESAPYDTPDYAMGEAATYQGDGQYLQATRYMYHPSKALGVNCYWGNGATPPEHAAAGVGDHWFYLVAEGSNPTSGQPYSPTCNHTTVTGIGLVKALQILYHAMLNKTSASSYLTYRLSTLASATYLFPGDCNAYNAVKAAWAAVGVPSQPGETDCRRPGPWIASAINADGRIDRYGNNGGWPTLRRTQTAPNAATWSPPNLFGGPALNVTDLAVAANADGRLELFGVGPTGIAHRWQTTVGGPWSDWVTFDQATVAGVPPPTSLVSVAVARHADRHLEMFAVDGVTGMVYRRLQNVAGTTDPAQWSPWISFGNAPQSTGTAVPPEINSIVAQVNSAGRVDVFATTVAGDVLFRREGPGAYEWSPWAYIDESQVDSPTPVRNFTALATATAVDGRLLLFGLWAGTVQVRYRGTPGGPWTYWSYLGNTIIDIDAESNANGLVSLFAMDYWGTVWQTTETSPGIWSPWVGLDSVGPAAIPDVRGMTAPQAGQALQSAGGFVSQVSYFVDLACNNLGTVATQSPVPGTVAEIGTVVRLRIGQRPSPPYVCA